MEIDLTDNELIRLLVDIHSYSDNILKYKAMKVNTIDLSVLKSKCEQFLLRPLIQAIGE